MEGDKVSDVDIAGGDQQEPEGRQQQQGLRPLRPRRPSKTWGGQVFRSYLLSRDDDDDDYDDDDDDDYYKHDNDFGDYEQNLSLSSQLRNQCLRVLGSVARFGAPTTREVRLGEKSKTAN